LRLLGRSGELFARLMPPQGAIAVMTLQTAMQAAVFT
jgi:hypothetical protein